MTKQETPERTHQKARGKDTERCHERGNRVPCREKVTTDDCGKIAVDTKVVPFHYITGDTGEDNLPFRPRTSSFQGCRLFSTRGRRTAFWSPSPSRTARWPRG